MPHRKLDESATKCYHSDMLAVGRGHTQASETARLWNAHASFSIFAELVVQTIGRPLARRSK